jgi:hypothetical protein
MILNPQETPFPARGAEPLPAWHAVESRQKQPATVWWLIAQPDHAALAGDLARALDSPCLPPLDDQIMRAISLHDEGWREFDSQGPRVVNGRPLSFFEIPPLDFLPAWRESIQCAEAVAPIAGVLVSEHFCRLGRTALARSLAAADEKRVQAFLAEESGRQTLLGARQSRTAAEIETLVDVLQFCDLLSLYLCTGSRDMIVFPQQFRGAQIHLRYEGELCRTDPPLFAGGISLAVPARKYPQTSGSSDSTLPFLLA